METTHSSDIIVLGAGMAGLSAARMLAEAGLKVTILEARDRIGGRIETVRPPGSSLPVELGAEYVHGQPPELLDLIREAGLNLFERDGEFACFDDGKLSDCSFDEAFRVLDELPASPDMTFADFVAQKELSVKDAARVQAYVEGFNAADASRIGTASLLKQQRAEEEIEGERAFRIVEGYDRLPFFICDRFLSAGGQLRLNTVATQIDWRPGEVLVTTNDSGSPQLQAKRAVIALPLGVLQARQISITPEPPTAMEAIDRLAMGAATRITLLFRERFWEAAIPNLSFVFAQQTIPSTWWTSAPHTNPTITGWIGGPRAKSAPTGVAFKEQALAALAEIFGRADLPELLLSYHTHDWQTDLCSLGAYSYAPKGAVDASDTLAIPIEKTIYFAGEHTDTTGHWGTVHAALRSGLRAALQALEG